jgi:hypothetical protein
MRNLIAGIDDPQHPYKSRSERLMAVLTAMARKFFTDEQMEKVINENPIGDHVRDQAKPSEYLKRQIKKAWDFAAEGITIDDFYAFMPMHDYIFVPTRAHWPPASIDSRLDRVKIGVNEDGTPNTVKASAWLDRNKPIEDMVWWPGEPMIIRDKLVDQGGWIPKPGATTFNTYRPAMIPLGDASKATPWVDLIKKLYPERWLLLIQWVAHHVQHPGVKASYALVLGGPPGIGKDTWLLGVQQAVGYWNFAQISPKATLDKNNAYVKSVIVHISELKDLGTELSRFDYYESTKDLKAAPPNTLRVHEKYVKPYWVRNCCGVVETTNNEDGFYLPEDDRRHLVEWSDVTRDEFPEGFWVNFHNWYQNKGGYGHVAAYLTELDLSEFNPHAVPPRTEAFLRIVQINRAPEETELANLINAMGNPDIVTVESLIDAAQPATPYSQLSSFALWLSERKNRRAIPRRLKAAGYVSVTYPLADHGQWTINGQRMVLYAKVTLNPRDRIAAATAFKDKGEAATREEQERAQRRDAEIAANKKKRDEETAKIATAKITSFKKL